MLETDVMSAEEARDVWLYQASIDMEGSAREGGREALDGAGPDQMVCGYLSPELALVFLGRQA